MPKAKLTKKMVAAATYDTKAPTRGSQWLWDTVRPGLALRLHPAGGKAWTFRYRTDDGQRREMSLGAYPKFDLDAAREKAGKLIGEVAKDRDPAIERKVKRAAPTVAKLIDEYEKRWLPKLRQPNGPKRCMAALRERWGTRRATTITRADVGDLHHEITLNGAPRAAGDEDDEHERKPAPYEANRWVQHVKALWNKGEEWGLLADGHPNPARKITLNQETSRDRWVTATEMPRLWKAIGGCSSLYVREFLKLVLFTGCRETELLSVTWEMVDLDRGEIRIPHEIRKGTRTRRQVATHLVPLAPETVTILESIPRVEGNDHVFPGRYGRGRLVNVNKPWGKVRTAAKLPDVTVHDLRRTVASWMKEAGEDTAVIAKVLGHVQPGGVTAIYARVGDRAPREALERHARRLIEVVSEREEKVVPIRRKAASQ